MINTSSNLFQICIAVRALDIVGKGHINAVGLHSVETVVSVLFTFLILGIFSIQIQVIMAANVIFAHRIVLQTERFSVLIVLTNG